jgi:hypothetical protein
MVGKLPIVGVCKVLANFNSLSYTPLLFMWILVSGSSAINIPIHHFAQCDKHLHKACSKFANLQLGLFHL